MTNLETESGLLALLSAMKGPDMTAAHIQMYQEGFFRKVTPDIAKYAVMLAIRTCTFRPSVAELWEIVDRMDGRPEPDEAWALYPKDEAASALVTEEMHEAAAVAWPLMQDGDMVAARVAFIEAYKAAVARARLAGKRVHWDVTLGTDPNRRYTIVEQLQKRLALSPAEAEAEGLRYGIAPNNQEQVLMLEAAKDAKRLEAGHEARQLGSGPLQDDATRRERGKYLDELSEEERAQVRERFRSIREQIRQTARRLGIDKSPD